jgi:hypothetical protein
MVSGYLSEGGFGIERGFVGDWAKIVRCRVSLSGVVPAFDVLEDRLAGSSAGGPGAPAEHLGLDGGDERLGDGVVPALTG